jgi:hypothetical protein
MGRLRHETTDIGPGTVYFGVILPPYELATFFFRDIFLELPGFRDVFDAATAEADNRRAGGRPWWPPTCRSLAWPGRRMAAAVALMWADISRHRVTLRSPWAAGGDAPGPFCCLRWVVHRGFGEIEFEPGG